MAYYYRSGQRIPVILAESARAARITGERAAITVPGWQAKPITARHILLFKQELVPADRSAADLRSLSRLISQKEQAQVLAERSTARAPSSPSVDAILKRPDLVTFPVAVKQSGDGLLISTGDVAAQFPAAIPAVQVEQIAASHHWTVAKTLPFVANGYVFRASKTDDPFAFANELVEKFGAQFAHPVFLEDIPNRSAPVLMPPPVERDLPSSNLFAGPRPALYTQQWHLLNAGQGGGDPGQDINAEGAWRITIGSPDIIYCVIDSGVSPTHECFRGPDKTVAGYDFEDSDADPSPTDSSHGTSCAALAVAGVNAGQVLGVAPNCRLMPIRRPTLSNQLGLAEAFAWAADHDADVISCSFGIDGQPWVLPDVVRSALEYATTHGRSGKGIPIFWAAGNGSELVSTDEWASSKFTIAIAASTDHAQKAPYSDFGPEISICAPSSGGTSGITTAANTGYTAIFGGTSAAAPIAAGVASLVLSLAPNLRWFELRDLLQQSARKIDPGGQYDYSGHSVYYGYGQVNALNALQGIPVLLEAERQTETTSLDRQINDFLAWIQHDPGGAAIASYVFQRRLDILALLQSSPTFRDALGRLLRFMADAASHLAASSTVSVPDEAWSAIQIVIQSLEGAQSRNVTSDRSNRSFDSTREVLMSTYVNSSSLTDALQKIANMIGSPQSPPVAAAASPIATSTTASGNQPSSGALSPQEREAIAKQIFYTLQVPLITRDQMLVMEQELPALIDTLRSLPTRPAARAELMQLIDAATKATGTSERAAGDQQQRLAAIGQVIVQDAFGSGSERNPALLLGLFMAAYTIVKNWKT